MPPPQHEADGHINSSERHMLTAPSVYRVVPWHLCRCLLLLSTLASGCAVNPVTGSRELVLISEGQEIQMGRDADENIVQSLGLVEDPGWQEYVQRLGERMAGQSERPDLPWTFRVVDDPVVNAFALPGGFVYITRGILGHFSSEAELAGVLGHEIGHVTARHSVNQMSRSQLAQFGLGVGSVLAPDLAPLAQAAEAGLGLLFLSYGREDERQADVLGLRYMTRDSYDPREMAETFSMLADASGAREGGRVPAFLSTHPDPLERRDAILQRIEAGEVSGEVIPARGVSGQTRGTEIRVGSEAGVLRGEPVLSSRAQIPPRLPGGMANTERKGGGAGHQSRAGCCDGADARGGVFRAGGA